MKDPQKDSLVTCTAVSSSTGGRFSPPSPCVASTNAASATSAEDFADVWAFDVPDLITSLVLRVAVPGEEEEAPPLPPPPPPPPSGLDELLLDDIK
jgi:hypothetical protein